MQQVQDILSKVQPAIAYSDIAFPPIAEKNKSIFFSILKRILTIIKKVFSYFVVAKTPQVFDLSQRQIRLINKSQNHRRKSVSRPLLQVPIEAIEKPEAPPSTFIANINKTRGYDPSLQALIQFLKSFSDVLINECVLNDYIKPGLPELKESLIEFLSGIENWTKVFQNLRESGSPLINGLKAVDDPAITLIVQQLLQYFVNLDRQTIHDHLTEKLQDICIAGKITEEQYTQALQYIDPVFSWLYHSNNWFLNTSRPANLHYFISDTFRFFSELVNQVQEGTFADFFQHIENFIQNDLDDEIEEILNINTQPITQILAQRLADLIEQMPFTETFDLLIHKIVEHTEGWISAEEVRKEQKQLIEKSQKVSKTRASTVYEIKQKREADKLKKLIEEDGSIENYLANEFTWAFSMHPSCHKKIKKLIQSKLSNDIMIEESEIYLELVEKLFPILIPNSQYTLPHGLEIEINGISEIIRQISLTDKLKELKKDMTAQFDNLIDVSGIQKKKNFREYFCIVAEIMIFEFVQSKIKGRIAASIQRAIERLSSKQYLDFLMKEHLLPSLLLLCLKGYASSYINRNLNQLTSPFHKMLIGHRLHSFEDLTDQLLENLYLEMQEEFIDFNLQDANIDQQTFNLCIRPYIIEIFEFIKEDAQKISKDNISIKTVKQSIEKYFKCDSVSINRDYGILTMNLLFRIGSFGGWFKKKLMGWFQNSISKSASQALNDARKDHKKLIDSIVETVNGSLLNADVIRETFFADEPSPKALKLLNKRVRKELPRQIKHLSAIIHDLFYRFLESSYIPLIRYTTPSTDTICILISDIFNQLFQQPSLNKSLVFSLTDIAQTAFESANSEIAQH